ncbi:hypothetical protein [Spirochaeta africana]|uniref:Uncharacterized protein n=1 Tax=Spirochaeta africana (strain ATCC 700263 / DSM 8902 / Z-7692) TaxID=889378 RepID=H9UJL3_SPIAZ|nr:hypothetical protein [Spirochaeta africana]AFG37706.1 hypothetical protein Spiaf_1648 [Spirochaeta africana DSM 8902]
MYHPKQREIDAAIKRMFDEIDHILEDRYRGSFPLHPARPQHGTTANPSADGLFNIGASFSPGYGSTHGRGYVIDVHLATLADVPASVYHQIEQETVELIQEKLPQYLPNRTLEVRQDGSLFKIVGNFRLGDI